MPPSTEPDGFSPAPFFAPLSFDDASAALAHVQAIYSGSVGHLHDALQRFVRGQTPAQRVRACYPFVRVQTDTVARADSRLSYGFVERTRQDQTTPTGSRGPTSLGSRVSWPAPPSTRPP
jgi:AMP nucleosidase